MRFEEFLAAADKVVGLGDMTVASKITNPMAKALIQDYAKMLKCDSPDLRPTITSIFGEVAEYRLGVLLSPGGAEPTVPTAAPREQVKALGKSCVPKLLAKSAHAALAAAIAALKHERRK